MNVRVFSNKFVPASGSSLTSKDFENGAKYNEELEGQANSTKREHFEQAMRFHQVAGAGKKRERTNYQEEENPGRKRGTPLRAVSKRWPNGEVPYILEDAFDENFRVGWREDHFSLSHILNA